MQELKLPWIHSTFEIVALKIVAHAVEVDMVVGFGWLSEIEDVPLVAVTTFWEFGKVDVLFWDFVSTAEI